MYILRAHYNGRHVRARKHTGKCNPFDRKKKKKKGINAEGHIGEGLSTASGMGVDE